MTSLNSLPIDTVITFVYKGKTLMSNGMPSYYWQIFLGQDDITSQFKSLHQRLTDGKDLVITNEFFFPFVIAKRISEKCFGLDEGINCELIDAEDLYTPIITEGFSYRYDKTIEYFRQRMKDENYPQEREQIITKGETLRIVCYGHTYEKKYAFDVYNSKGTIVNETIFKDLSTLNDVPNRLLTTTLDYKTGLLRCSTWKDYRNLGCFNILEHLITNLYEVSVERDAELVTGGGLGRYKITEDLNKEMLLGLLTK